MTAQAAIVYAQDVVADRIEVCELVHRSCERFLNDLEQAKQPESPWEFRSDLADRCMRFVQLMPNIKGPLAGKPIKLMPWQCFVLANLFGFVERGTDTRRFRQAVIYVPRGNGKGLALDTEIATPSGFTTMRDVAIGDVVFDRDGHPCRVTYVSPIHRLPCYEVEFCTGETVICDNQHLWLTQDVKERDNARHRETAVRRCSGSIESVKSVTQIAESVEYGTGKYRQKNHRVRVAASLQCGIAELSIDPYVLGYWLGDGHSACSRITVGAQDSLAFAVAMAVCRESVKGQVSLTDTVSYYMTNAEASRSASLQARLRKLNVLDNKHIPSEYLRAAAWQRWRLLQGLMDSDGSSSPQGQCEFSNMNRTLAEDVLELAASLGLRPTIREKEATLHGNVIGKAYRVTFHAYADQYVFALPRKQSRLPQRTTKHSYQINRMIVDVRETETVSTRCIQVDSQSRTYLVGRSLIPTHNTTFSAPLALYTCFAEGEGGAEGYAAATTRDQAKLLWDTAKQMVQQTPKMAKTLGIHPGAHSIYQTRTGSKLLAVSADAKSLEGLSVHYACCDEIASHISSHVYDVLLTAMGKRKHPLLLSISTATGNNHGIGRTLWDYACRVLNGDQTDDRMFTVIYTVDARDNPWEESSWIKANPGWGVSVQPDAIRAIMAQARNNPAQESAAMTRHLNVWTGADEALFSTRAWRECADSNLNLDDFEGETAEIAVDLASKIDLASISIVFPSRIDNKPHYTAFGRHFINESAVLEGRNVMYPAWAAKNHLIITPGNETDFQTIESEIIELCKRFDVRSVAYDPWNATQLAQRLQAEGINCVEVRQNVANLSEPTKELQAAMQSHRIHHNGDPVLEWCIGNVCGMYDKNQNVKPNRAREEAKIDAALALIMSVARCIVNEQADSIYETRGPIFLSPLGSYTAF